MGKAVDRLPVEEFNEEIRLDARKLASAVADFDDERVAEVVDVLGEVFTRIVDGGHLSTAAFKTRLIMPSDILPMVERMLEKQGQALALRSPCYRKLKLLLDMEIGEKIRHHIMEAKAVPTRADANFHMLYATHVRQKEPVVRTFMNVNAVRINYDGSKVPVVDRIMRWVGIRREVDTNAYDVAVLESKRLGLRCIGGFIDEQEYDLQNLDQRTAIVLQKMLHEAISTGAVVAKGKESSKLSLLKTVRKTPQAK